MEIGTIRERGEEMPVVVDRHRGVAPVKDLVPGFTGDLRDVIEGFDHVTLGALAANSPEDVFRPVESAEFAPPYRHPRLIWGIGLNFVEHASDLSELPPEEPASFIKGDHTIIGPGDEIVLPEQSRRVTAEAELGIVIGRHASNVSEAEAIDCVWGLVPILDQTAEDILQRNPRFLTRSKNFPTFFSFGPTIKAVDDVIAPFGALDQVLIETVHNGKVHRANTVSNMRFSPAFLISFHSKVFPLQPGDIISPGTPGAVVIEDGDVVECRIPGVEGLVNTVRRPSGPH
jgi:2-keto-4-pentenoate hydratase/2-oxohepta-3-ene-1,7-dioic acid hydratase in catechol pathway